MADDDPSVQVRRVAENLLTRREHTQQELTFKLQRRGFEPSIIANVIHQLQQENLQSDSRFVEAYIYARTQKGYGPIKIQQELQQRGIDRDLIKHYLALHAAQWPVLAQAAKTKRFGNNPSRDMAERAKQQRFLHYRGFTAEHIVTVFEDGQ
ncbi:MAG: recombination regulator RecX [Gammaproteobacteria bacterium]